MKHKLDTVNPKRTIKNNGPSPEFSLIELTQSLKSGSYLFQELDT